MSQTTTRKSRKQTTLTQAAGYAVLENGQHLCTVDTLAEAEAVIRNRKATTATRYLVGGRWVETAWTTHYMG